MQSQIQKTYLYTISRSDIPLAQQSVQSGHAAIEHAYTYGRPPDDHPSYIHLSTKNKESLAALKLELQNNNINTAEFHEPYQDWGLTAIACILTEDNRHLLKGLKLWRLPTQEK